MSREKISVLGVGDVGPDRDSPESIFAQAAPALRKADILFGQLETNLSERGAPQLHAIPGLRVHPRHVSALTYAGFHVMSFASNHTLDWGEPALLDTLDILKKNNITVIGAGKNIEEARKPAIFERKGTRVAFLAYCSVLPKGFDARPDKPGAVPVRASTFYEQVDWQAGTPPRIVTFADRADLAAMVDDIKKVRPLADVVIMSIHWGIHMVPAMLAMYQKEVGYAAIDAGVDLILGHHAHILKGIEVYKGKVIFYSLCNFAFDIPITRTSSWVKQLYGIKPDPEYPTYFFAPDSRKTMVAKCTISDKKIDQVSFLPVMINKQGQPEILTRADKRSTEVLDYVKWCCEDQKLNARFSWAGDEVVVNT